MSADQLSDEDLGYFFAFESFPGPWPLDGFVAELGEVEEDHRLALEALVARGLVERVAASYQPTEQGRAAFADSRRLIRAKGLLDGAETLAEAAAKLRAEAEHLEELEQDGWQLVDVVSDDYGHLQRSRDSVLAKAKERGLERQVAVEIDPARGRLSDLAELAGA